MVNVECGTSFLNAAEVQFVQWSNVKEVFDNGLTRHITDKKASWRLAQRMLHC